MIRPGTVAAVCALLLIGCGEHPEKPAAITPDQAIDQSIAKAEDLIQALEAYKQSRLVYPASLDELVPAQLESIPVPDAGPPQWHYSRDSSGLQFELGFGPVGGLEVDHFYSSATGEWGSVG